jgi:hypothetical protein
VEQKPAPSQPGQSSGGTATQRQPPKPRPVEQTGDPKKLDEGQKSSQRGQQKPPPPPPPRKNQEKPAPETRKQVD